jgi:ATP-binding cassette subfamily C protein LapB
MRDTVRLFFSRTALAVELTLSTVFVNLLALAVPLFVIQVLNRYVSYGIDETLATLTIGVVIAVFFEQGFRRIRLGLAGVINEQREESLNQQSFGTMLRTKFSAIMHIPVGIKTEMVRGMDAVRSASSAGNIVSLLDAPFSLLFILAISLISPTLAIVVIIAIAASILIAIFGRSTFEEQTKKLQGFNVETSGMLVDAIDSADTLRVFNGTGKFLQKWNQKQTQLQKLKGVLAFRQANVASKLQGVAALMSISVIAMGAMQVVEGSLSVGAMIGINILASRALSPITKVTQLSLVFAEAKKAKERIIEFSKLPMDVNSGSALSEYSGRIEFNDLMSIYPGATTPLFESLNLKINSGTTTVITGPNGAGKTTLIRILTGLLEPARGHVFADGMNLRQLAIEWWRSQISYLPQEPTFIRGSIRENILLSNPDLDEETLNNIIKQAGLRSYIESIADGLDQIIDQRGSIMALGIRQRVAIARALATQGQLVLFDEPTSGLDSEGCDTIYKLFNTLIKQKKTIIIVSHDPLIVKAADYHIDLTTKPVPLVRSRIETKDNVTSDVSNEKLDKNDSMH